MKKYFVSILWQKHIWLDIKNSLRNYIVKANSNEEALWIAIFQWKQNEFKLYSLWMFEIIQAQD